MSESRYEGPVVVGGVCPYLSDYGHVARSLEVRHRSRSLLLELADADEEVACNVLDLAPPHRFLLGSRVLYLCKDTCDEHPVDHRSQGGDDVCGGHLLAALQRFDGGVKFLGEHPDCGLSAHSIPSTSSRSSLAPFFTSTSSSVISFALIFAPYSSIMALPRTFRCFM